MRISDKNIDRIYISSQTRSASYKMTENHSHNYYELYYLEKGTCTFLIHDEQYVMHAGDFIVIPPRLEHFNHYLTSCVRINIYFRIQDIMEQDHLFIPNILESYIPTKVLNIPSGSRSNIETILDQMLKEEKMNDMHTYFMMPLLLKALFIDIKRFCVVPLNVDTDHNSEIIEAVRYIASHYNEPLTLESLASQANLSPTYFSKKFHMITGMGMKEFITYTRLKHGAVELLSTTHSITEIALNSGFSNSNYFKDAFKKLYDMSPREYRNATHTDAKLQESLEAEAKKTQNKE